jgi:hypothetical protein
VARKLAALLLAGLAGLATVPARADEALVMRLIFEDCLGYVRHGRTPFAGLATRPAPPAVIAELPARMPDRDKAVELLSPRYVASWGADAMARHCMVRTVFEAVQAGAPAKLGVKAEGFVSRVDARAKAAGLTQAETAEHFSPIASNLWSEPGTGHESGPLRPVSLSLLATTPPDADGIADAGLFVMADPPLPAR